MMRGSSDNRRGTVMILVLWALGLLTVLAVNVGVYVQQKATFVKRIEQRAFLRRALESAARMSLAVYQKEQEVNELNDPLLQKQIRHNNPEDFKDIRLGQALASVGHDQYKDNGQRERTLYGVEDEQGRLNLNRADEETLKRLFTKVLRDEDTAEKLAKAAFDWRQFGTSEIVGFFSDDFYSQLEYPYDRKKANYEVPDELRLVKGFTDPIYRRVEPFLTVYGGGGVNVNSASRPVLFALGMSDRLVSKVMTVRQGIDGVDGSGDDTIFFQPGSIVPQLLAAFPLNEEEQELLAELVNSGQLSTGAGLLRVNARARINGSKQSAQASCVIEPRQGRIVYWREQ